MEDFTESTGEDWLQKTKKEIHHNIEEAMWEVMPKLPEVMKETFDKAGARGGREPWLVTYNPTPLIDTGALRSSFKATIDYNPIVGEDTDYILVVGTDKDYARKHNEGLGFPVREFMFFTDDDLKMVVDTIHKHVGGQSG